MQLAGEHRDAVHPGLVPKPVAGHADLAAAGLEQHHLIEVGPLLNREIKAGGQGRRPRERNAHEPWLMRTRVLARLRALGRRGPLELDTVQSKERCRCSASLFWPSASPWSCCCWRCWQWSSGVISCRGGCSGWPSGRNDFGTPASD